MRPVLALLAAASLALGARAESTANSKLDAPLFYQLLIGEMEAQRGEFGVSYQLLLDAARRTGDEQLFRRAVQVAVEARAGGEALAAARAWREQLGGLAAQQHVVQLAVALGQPAEAAIPLLEWALLQPSTEQRAALLTALPQLLRPLKPATRALDDMEPLLAKERDNATLPAERRMLAAALIARLAQHGGNEALALNQLREAHNELPASSLPALLALDLMRLAPEAEQLVLPRLEQDRALQLAYARQLARDHRVREALVQFERLRAQDPAEPAHDYAIATLLLELRRPADALRAVDAYLQRVSAPALRGSAMLLKAQAHGELRQWREAEAVLAEVPGEGREADIAYRRALADARQGRLAQARERLRGLPGEAKPRLLREVQLLRELQQWQPVHELLSEALTQEPRDTDLLYEHAMSAERLGQHALMEQQLRRVIELDPEHHHAHNALGYSLADRNLRLTEARQLIERAIELGGHEPFIVDSLGWVAFREGNLDEAERWLRQAHRARPDAEIAAHLAELLSARGRADEARALLVEAQGLEPDNAVLKSTRKRLGL